MQIVITDQISPDLARKLTALENRRPLMRAAAQAARDAMRAHYARQPGNERGWPGRGFWDREGVNKVAIARFDNDSATVVVDSTLMGHRYFGGPVSPKRAKYLAIPLNSKAYQTGSPTMLSDQPVNQRRKKSKRKAPRKFVKEFPTGERYLFTRGPVTHRPDPRAFPPEADVNAAVGAVIEEKADLILRVS